MSQGGGRRFPPGRSLPAAAIVAALAGLAATSAAAAAARGQAASGDPAFTTQLLRVLTLQDYNTRVVVAGTMMLGLAAGIVGTYMLLRRRALIGDALSHATLPGIGIAFIVMVSFGGSGKSLPGLLAGAVIAGGAGMLSILVITRLTRIKEDAALGIVLSVFFGLGIAILGVIQKMSAGSAAGLDSFIYGKTASMLRGDAIAIGVAALVVVVLCAALYKEFAILSFDGDFAGSQGWPVLALDVLMMALVGAVTVIGLQAVGLILIIAMIIIPPAAARFWTSHLRRMLMVAGAIGAASGLAGAALSALIPRLPAGAIIVVVASGIFLASMVVGGHRGILVLALERAGLERRIARQHLLRAMYEIIESAASGAEPAADEAALLGARTWTPRALRRALRSAARADLVERPGPDRRWRLTGAGRRSADRVVRNHRLWELYLIHHADIAPSHVDRDADQIEHVLGSTMLDRLEMLLARETADREMPASPHVLEPRGGGGGAP